MTHFLRNPLFFLLMVLATFVLLDRPSDITAMQLEESNTNVDINEEGEEGEEEEDEVATDFADEDVASFSEIDADALAEKLDTQEEEENEVPEDAEEEADLDEEEEDGVLEGNAEETSFLEGENEEDMEGEEVDLSQMSEEDVKAVMDMLNPEEQAAFQDMLNEHKGVGNREEEL